MSFGASLLMVCRNPYSFIEDIFTVRAKRLCLKGHSGRRHLTILSQTTLSSHLLFQARRKAGQRQHGKTRQSEVKRVSRQKGQSALTNIQRKRLDAQLDLVAHLIVIGVLRVKNHGKVAQAVRVRVGVS